MKTGWLIVVVAILLFSFLLGFPTCHNAQDSAAQADNSQHAKHGLAIGLLRAINTAEMEYRAKNGTFASWSTLLLTGSFQRKTKRSTGPRVVLADEEIPAGWKLRFNLIGDSQGYDVLLEDATDKEQGYALLTDERGLIRECKGRSSEPPSGFRKLA